MWSQTLIPPRLPRFQNLYKHCQVYNTSPSPNKADQPSHLPSSPPFFALQLSAMRTFNFTLFAVLSYVAVIGATSLEARAPAEAIDPRGSPICQCSASDTDCIVCHLETSIPACTRMCSKNYLYSICASICDHRPDLQYCSTMCEDDPDWSFCSRLRPSATSANLT
ncbi:hypothetical protein BGY98DRAFT_83902 [Russula aff. rugulosa BPL654]|nr:hypothetical protein BGY98DRAFT_83902 [Russula aff. rugulosa BPL654]